MVVTETEFPIRRLCRSKLPWHPLHHDGAWRLVMAFPTPVGAMDHLRCGSDLSPERMSR